MIQNIMSVLFNGVSMINNKIQKDIITLSYESFVKIQ